MMHGALQKSLNLVLNQSLSHYGVLPMVLVQPRAGLAQDHNRAQIGKWLFSRLLSNIAP